MLHVTPGLKGVYSSKFQDHENQDLQCPRAEEDEYSGELKTENPPFLRLCSLWVLNQLNDAHPYWGEEPSLLRL